MSRPDLHASLAQRKASLHRADDASTAGDDDYGLGILGLPVLSDEMSWGAEMTGQGEDGHDSVQCMTALQSSGYADGFLDDSCLWECTITEDCALPVGSLDLATVFDDHAPRALEHHAKAASTAQLTAVENMDASDSHPRRSTNAEARLDFHTSNGDYQGFRMEAEGQQHVAREQFVDTSTESKSDTCGQAMVPNSGSQSALDILDEFNDYGNYLLGDEFDSEFLLNLSPPGVHTAATLHFTAAGHVDTPHVSHDAQPRPDVPSDVKVSDPSVPQNMVPEGCEIEHADLEEFFHFLDSSDLDGFDGISCSPWGSGGEHDGRCHAQLPQHHFDDQQHDERELQTQNPAGCLLQLHARDGGSESTLCNSLAFVEASTGPGLTTSPASDAAPPPTSSVPLLCGKQLSMIDIAKYDDSATEGQGGAQGLLCLRPGVPVSHCMDEGGDPWCPSMDTPWPTDGAQAATRRAASQCGDDPCALELPVPVRRGRHSADPAERCMPLLQPRVRVVVPRPCDAHDMDAARQPARVAAADKAGLDRCTLEQVARRQQRILDEVLHGVEDVLDAAALRRLQADARRLQATLMGVLPDKQPHTVPGEHCAAEAAPPLVLDASCGLVRRPEGGAEGQVQSVGSCASTMVASPHAHGHCSMAVGGDADVSGQPSGIDPVAGTGPSFPSTPDSLISNAAKQRQGDRDSNPGPAACSEEAIPTRPSRRLRIKRRPVDHVHRVSHDSTCRPGDGAVDHGKVADATCDQDPCNPDQGRETPETGAGVAVACKQGSPRRSSAHACGGGEGQGDGRSDTESEDEKDLRALAVHACTRAVCRAPAASRRKPPAPMACAAKEAPPVRSAPTQTAAQPCAVQTSSAQPRRARVDVAQPRAAQPSAAQPCVPKSVLQADVSAQCVSEKCDGTPRGSAHPTATVAAPATATAPGVDPASSDCTQTCAHELQSREAHVQKPEGRAGAANAGQGVQPATGLAAVARRIVNGTGCAPAGAEASTAAANGSAADKTRLAASAVCPGRSCVLSAAAQDRSPPHGHRAVPKHTTPATVCKSTGAPAPRSSAPAAPGAAVSAKHGAAMVQKSRSTPSAPAQQVPFNPCKRRPVQPAAAADAARHTPSSGKPGGDTGQGPSTKPGPCRRSHALDKRPRRDMPDQNAASSMELREKPPTCFATGGQTNQPQRSSERAPVTPAPHIAAPPARRPESTSKTAVRMASHVPCRAAGADRQARRAPHAPGSSAGNRLHGSSGSQPYRRTPALQAMNLPAAPAAVGPPHRVVPRQGCGGGWGRDACFQPTHPPARKPLPQPPGPSMHPVPPRWPCPPPHPPPQPQPCYRPVPPSCPPPQRQHPAAPPQAPPGQPTACATPAPPAIADLADLSTLRDLLTCATKPGATPPHAVQSQVQLPKPKPAAPAPPPATSPSKKPSSWATLEQMSISKPVPAAKSTAHKARGASTAEPSQRCGTKDVLGGTAPMVSPAEVPKPSDDKATKPKSVEPRHRSGDGRRNSSAPALAPPLAQTGAPARQTCERRSRPRPAEHIQQGYDRRQPTAEMPRGSVWHNRCSKRPRYEPDGHSAGPAKKEPHRQRHGHDEHSHVRWGRAEQRLRRADASPDCREGNDRGYRRDSGSAPAALQHMDREQRARVPAGARFTLAALPSEGDLFGC